MWWFIGIGGTILYLTLLFTIGLVTLRNGHGWMFFFGIFFPLLWLIGAHDGAEDSSAHLTHIHRRPRPEPSVGHIAQRSPK